MSEPHVDVLIVNYLTGDMAAALAAAVAGPGRHVLVYDNSGDVDPAAIAAFGGTLVVSEHNAFYAHGNNVLYDMCDGEYVLLLNPDVMCSGADIDSLVSQLEAVAGAYGVLPRMRNPDGSEQVYYRRLPTTRSLLCDRVPPLRLLFRRTWRRYLCADLTPTALLGVEAPAGACLLLRRAAVGPRLFDERYPLFFNDTDLARRLSPQTCRLVPSVEVTHVKGASLARERQRRPWAISRSYDESARVYARDNLRGWPLVYAVSTVRIWTTRLLERRSGDRAA